MIIFAYHVDGDDIQFFKSNASNEIEATQQFLRHMDLQDEYKAYLEEDYEGTILDWLYEYSEMNVGWIRV